MTTTAEDIIKALRTALAAEHGDCDRGPSMCAACAAMDDSALWLAAMEDRRMEKPAHVDVVESRP